MVMRLVHKIDGKQVDVSVGYIFTHDGDMHEVTYMPKPSKPSSTGKVSCSNITKGTEEIPYYAQVYNMEWIEREDQGWMPDEEALKAVKDIYLKLFEMDISAMTEIQVVKLVRHTPIVNFPTHSMSEFKFVHSWIMKKINE